MSNEKFRDSENQYENNDEDYGLPHVSYEPVNRDDAREPIIMNPKDHETSKKNTYKKESSWPIIIGLIIVVALAAVFIYLFLIKTPEAPPVAQTPAPVVEEIPEVEEFETVVDSEWNNTPQEPAKPAVGTVSMISSRTGQAYIIAGSFIDVDLAQDYGNKLSGEGVSTTIIKPYGKVKYYRLAVANYPTVGEALNGIEQLKTNYGENIWVLKY